MAPVITPPTASVQAFMQGAIQNMASSLLQNTQAEVIR
ncbi:hypothetical protein D791_00225 [Nitrincola nitratireducens]|uniref:Uncharacterized protein n=1 Tax=Nitrincola nitratireducens TaxID=1229521 RepID=W9V090_9GAMM|nr:hypothetical protein D791_00225 [Nitrincola nitratireducens]